MKQTKATIIAFILILVTVFAAFPATVSYGEEVNCYTLVTSVSELADGDRVILASIKEGRLYAASTKKRNYRISAQVVEDGGVIYGDPATNSADTTAFEFTLDVDNGYYCFYDSLNSGYLCATAPATSTGSRMGTSATLTDACRFSISIGNDGSCMPLAKDIGFNGKMTYMPDSETNGVFVCSPESNTAGEAIFIYKYTGKNEPPVIDDSSKEPVYLCTFDVFNAEYYKDTETVKYYGEYSGALAEGFIYVFTMNDARGFNINKKNVESADIAIGDGKFSYSYSLSASAANEFVQPFTVNVACFHSAQAIKPVSTAVTVLENEPVTNYTVDFIFGSGGTLEGTLSVSVPAGTELASLDFPEPKPDVGYEFFGWSETIGAVNNDTVITATFIKKSYAVTFYDFDNRFIVERTVEHGDAAIAPADPVREGFNFIGWSENFNNVTEPLDVFAQYEIKTYTVTFVAGDGGTIIGDTTVSAKHGTPIAELDFPLVEADAGFVFSGWSCDGETVLDDVTILAEFKKNYTLGDVDADGEITPLDATLVLQYDAALTDFNEAQFIAADVNGDGYADCFDALQILRFDAKLIDSFPIAKAFKPEYV